MTVRPEELYGAPNALAPEYSAFRVDERLLLTGHSHQAWPDVSRAAQERAWRDAAEHVDEKWERARERADRVRDGYRRLLGDDGSGEIALGQNTHELVVRFLSALPLAERPRVVTTGGEFHSLRRQVDRLAEEGIEVVKVAARPVDTLAERLAAEVDEGTAAAMVSSVLFETAEIVPHLEAAARACERAGAELLVDAYHHLNVVPFDVAGMGLERAWVVGGGYKYCQLGEGAAFLRFPADTDARPVVTGWFAEFAGLEAEAREGRVRYGSGPERFAGATYDPVSHYRAAAVFDFFRERGLTPELLREVSRHQVGLLARLCAESPLAAAVSLPREPGTAEMEELAGFLALETPRAGELCAALRERGVRTDHRGELLRLGPAPYLSDAQLEEAVGRLSDVV